MGKYHPTTRQYVFNHHQLVLKLGYEAEPKTSWLRTEAGRRPNWKCTDFRVLGF